MQTYNILHNDLPSYFQRLVHSLMKNNTLEREMKFNACIACIKAMTNLDAVSGFNVVCPV